MDILQILYKDNNKKPINELKEYFHNNQTEFDNLKKNFLEECHDYGKILFGWMKVLALIYFCLFLISITLAGVAMMFYACLKRQGYLITIMHVLWNIIRFFMFSFFIFGAAYGIFDLVLKDTVALIKKLFSDENLGNIKDLVPKEFLQYCLQKESNFASKIIKDDKLISEFQNFYYTYKELKDILKEEEKTCTIEECYAIKNMTDNLGSLCSNNDLK